MTGHVPSAADFGLIVGTAIREAIAPLQKRIDMLEADQRIDAQTIEELGKAIARIAVLEKSIDGRGLKFLGHYNSAIEYQKGDVVSHGGALWVPIKPTNEPPGSGNYDWVRMLKAEKRSGFASGDER